MADDLKLEIVIQALLDAKGFEDAKANLEGLTATANKAAPAVKATGDAAAKMGQSYGGTRGPVADVTRVLLQNVGVTGAAGEAAKAAGTAMYFMEGAATAANVAVAGGVAAVALLLPLVVRWMTATKEQTVEQKDLLSSLKDTLPTLEKYAATVKTMTDAATIQLLAARGRALREEAAELEKIEAEIARIEPLLRAAFEAGQKGMALTQSYGLQAEKLVELKARADDLRQSQSQNLTLAQMYARYMDASATPAIVKQTAAVEKLTVAQQMAIDQEIDAVVDMRKTADKDAAKQKKADADEVRRILDLRDLQEQQIIIDRQVAAGKVALQQEMAAAAAYGFSALLQLFGKNKAAAIAETIISTNVAAAKALAEIPWPANVVVAASLYAQGLARANEIRKTEAVGFDDPFADLTARKLGQKSAVDFVRNFGGAFSPGVQAGMGAMGGASNTTINRGTTINMGGIHGALGPRPAFDKWLERAMTKATRNRGRTTVGR